MDWQDRVEKAYLFLKNYYYYDNMNFYMKYQISQFENSADFPNIAENILNIIHSPQPLDHPIFNKWLDNINFKIHPKTFTIEDDLNKPANNKNIGVLVSNIRTAKHYHLKGVNYFIDAPIELHIISVLWTIEAGIYLDNSMERNVYGNRIKTNNKKDLYNSTSLFKLPFPQYNEWRNKAIHTAESILDEKYNAGIMALDIRSFYYSIYTSYDDIIAHITSNHTLQDKEDLILIKVLTKMLFAIHNKFSNMISSYYNFTHYYKLTNNSLNSGIIPIGLLSSPVIANWYLNKLDKDMTEIVKPEYYGRYVDDILLVFKDPPNDTPNLALKMILSSIAEVSDDTIRFTKYNMLEVQNSKLIYHYFEKDHSRAGLKIFKREIERTISTFVFLPEEDIESNIDDVAYNLQYEGSKYKIRNVVGMIENDVELSKYIATQITAYRLCESTTKDAVIDQLFKFFQGKNLLDFCRLWEKVFSFAVIRNRFTDIIKFYNRANELIDLVIYNNTDIIDDNIKAEVSLKLKNDLKEYLALSLAIPCGLLNLRISEELTPNKRFNNFISKIILDEKHSLIEAAIIIRKANLIKHYYVAFPLANYTNYLGSLLDAYFYNNLKKNERLAIEDRLKKYSPRYIYLDEELLFEFLIYLKYNKIQDNNWLTDALDKYSKYYTFNNDTIAIDKLSDGDSIDFNKIKISGRINKSINLKIAIANIKVNQKDVEASFRKDKEPNISPERQAILYKILNESIKENVRLLILPELSIPHHWLPFMISHSRKHQIGIIFGLEHWVIEDSVYNFIVTLLPYELLNGYNNCIISIRPKNYYAPQEELQLRRYHLNPISRNPHYYELFNWHGIHLAPYNCFELANIKHRAIFDSELDILVACVLNKDVNYYENIMESVVRDLHCYVAEVNTSDYGGSCILQPTKTETMSIIKVKGGENSCILTATLDIEKLRDFQFGKFSEIDKRFKPTPPGYDHSKVLKRGKR